MIPRLASGDHPSCACGRRAAAGRKVPRCRRHRSGQRRRSAGPRLPDQVPVLLLVGELLGMYARRRGVAGFVIDGAIRDVRWYEDFPCYARANTHRGPYKDGPGEINVPVSVGGLVIAPRDLVLGDEDGVVAIHAAEAGRVLELARAKMREEERERRAILDPDRTRTALRCSPRRWSGQRATSPAHHARSCFRAQGFLRPRLLRRGTRRFPLARRPRGRRRGSDEARAPQPPRRAMSLQSRTGCFRQDP